MKTSRAVEARSLRSSSKQVMRIPSLQTLLPQRSQSYAEVTEAVYLLATILVLLAFGDTRSLSTRLHRSRMLDRGGQLRFQVRTLFLCR